MTTSITKQKLSVKVQTGGAILAMLSAVAIPQLVHLLGDSLGHGTALGEMLLPMQLPIILAGLLVGPYAAGIAGILSPLISFTLTGMPTAAMLPFMMLELAVYGICAGILKDVKMSDIPKVLITQLSGRAVRGIAIIAGFYCFNSAIRPEIILTSIKIGFVGIILQLVLIPLIASSLRKADEAHNG